MIPADRYVYGFDEKPIADEGAVYQIFGGIKAKWPDISTVAVLDWPHFADNLPLNVWVTTDLSF